MSVLSTIAPIVAPMGQKERRGASTDSASQSWSRWSVSNRRPAVYETNHLPCSVRKNTDLGLSTAKTAFLFWNGAEVARSCAAPIFAPMGGVQWI